MSRIQFFIGDADRVEWITESWVNALVSVVGTLVAVATIGATVWGLRRAQLRLHVNLGTCLVLGNDVTYGALSINVTNDSPATAQVGRVSIEDRQGKTFMLSARDGKTCPYRLDAHGGQATWMFDLQQVKEEVSTRWLGQPVELRGVVQVGRRRFFTTETVPIVDGTVGNANQPRRARVGQWWESVRHPEVQLLCAQVTAEGARAGICDLIVLNGGHGFAAPRQIGLVLMDSEGTLRATGAPLQRCGWIGPNKQVVVSVPLVDADDSAEGEYMWTILGSLHRLSALTRQQAAELLTEGTLPS